MNNAMVTQETATDNISKSTKAAASENELVLGTVHNMTELADNAQKSATNIYTQSQDVTHMTQNLQQDVQKFIDFLKKRMED